MFKARIQRLHKWTALVFALPLVVVFITGLILAFEPLILSAMVIPQSVDGAKLEAILAKHDPDGKLERLFLHPHLDTVVLGNRGGVEVDLRTGEPNGTHSLVLAVFAEARHIHETLLIDDGHTFVTISTSAMLVLIVLGLLLGTRPLRNTASGWHTGAAWIALPLIITAPLTGLMMLYKVTLSGPEPKLDAVTKAFSLAEALRVIGRERDVATLLSLRQRKGITEVRFIEDGEHRNYFVTPDGLVVRPRNWPKLLHEGNWAGVWSAAANATTAITLLTLLGTGIFIWGRRKLRRRQRFAQRATAH